MAVSSNHPFSGTFVVSFREGNPLSFNRGPYNGLLMVYIDCAA